MPDVEAARVLALGDPWNVLAYAVQPGVLLPVPDELALWGLFDFDCDDAEAIAAFEREHGRLRSTWLATSDRESDPFPPFIADEPSTWKGSQHVRSEKWQRSRLGYWNKAYPEIVSDDEVDAFLNGWGSDDLSVADLSMTVRALRACARHLVAATEPNAERVLPRVWRDQGFEVGDASNAWYWFCRVVNDRLDPFRICVFVAGEHDERRWRGDCQLENALALQIMNYVIEHASFRRCENELCSNTFPIDFAGRKRRKFCSDKCAKRQGVRNSRNREKKERAR